MFELLPVGGGAGLDCELFGTAEDAGSGGDFSSTFSPGQLCSAPPEDDDTPSGEAALLSPYVQGSRADPAAGHTWNGMPSPAPGWHGASTIADGGGESGYRVGLPPAAAEVYDCVGTVRALGRALCPRRPLPPPLSPLPSHSTRSPPAAACVRRAPQVAAEEGEEAEAAGGAHTSFGELLSATKCSVCRSGAQPAQMLLCDGCSAGYHTYCLSPALPAAPAGDWFCPSCTAKSPGSREHMLDEQTAIEVARRWYDTESVFAVKWKLRMQPVRAYRNSARVWSIRYTTKPDSGETFFVRVQYEAVREQGAGGSEWRWHALTFTESGASVGAAVSNHGRCL
jgi:hypothetical protein